MAKTVISCFENIGKRLDPKLYGEGRSRTRFYFESLNKQMKSRWERRRRKMDPSRAAEKWKKERMKQINEAEQRNETRKLALRNCEKDEKDSIRGFLFLSLSFSFVGTTIERTNIATLKQIVSLSLFSFSLSHDMNALQRNNVIKLLLVQLSTWCNKLWQDFSKDQSRPLFHLFYFDLCVQ